MEQFVTDCQNLSYSLYRIRLVHKSDILKLVLILFLQYEGVFREFITLTDFSITVVINQLLWCIQCIFIEMIIKIDDYLYETETITSYYCIHVLSVLDSLARCLPLCYFIVTINQ